MIDVYERLGAVSSEPIDGILTLDHEQRDKGRQLTVTQDGREVRLFLDRGNPLRPGECLRSQCGKVLRIEAAQESVITAFCEDWRVFSRACYHLGNRHVKLQIGDLWLRIAPDHVLEAMLQQLGLGIRSESAVFIPETGAYGHGHPHH